MILPFLSFLKGLSFEDMIAWIERLAFLGLIVACFWLHSNNKELQLRLDQVVPVAEKQTKLLQECDANTKALVDTEKKNSDDAKAAVEQAKKEAAAERQRADDLAHRKPREIVITKDNAKDYGGTDTSAQMKDYLATHDLANEEIARRAKK